MSTFALIGSIVGFGVLVSLFCAVIIVTPIYLEDDMKYTPCQAMGKTLTIFLVGVPILMVLFALFGTFFHPWQTISRAWFGVAVAITSIFIDIIVVGILVGILVMKKKNRA